VRVIHLTSLLLYQHSLMVSVKDVPDTSLSLDTWYAVRTGLCYADRAVTPYPDNYEINGLGLLVLGLLEAVFDL